MDNHKMLYKDNPYTPRKHSKINRELMEEKRIKQRRARYQDSRNVSPSPVRIKKEVIVPLSSPENNENVNNVTGQQNKNSTRLAKIVCSATNAEKLNKQEAFIKRFVEWKEKKSTQKKQEATTKKKPFVSAVSSTKQTSSSSFVPSSHHKGFRPPEGLKKPVVNELENKNDVVKGRQSIYTVIPTPPRKRSSDKCTNKFPIARKAVPKNIHAKLLNSNKTTNESKNFGRTDTKPKTTNKIKIKTEEKNKATAKQSPIKSTAKVPAVNVARTVKTKPYSTATFAQPAIRKNIKPRALKMSPPHYSTRSAVTATNKQPGAVAKIRTMIEKRSEIAKQTKKSPLKGGRARLAQNLKAKKNIQKFNVPVIKINGKDLLNLVNQPVEEMVIQTPRDFFTPNPFEGLVTSTRIKNSENVEGISSVERSDERLHSNSSAKRNIMQKETNPTLMLEAADTALTKNDEYKVQETNKENGLQNVTKKYNFIRYSDAACVSAIDQKDNDKIQVKEGKENTLSDEINKTAEAPACANNIKTPTKHGPEERPTNYLSPFVSVTRGKVSLKKEKLKRNSVYLQNDAQTVDLPTDLSTTPKYSVEVRRTLEGVRYFRKQLQDEIDRLHQLCEIWEAYKNENLEKIQNANGEDMINVTIGQTRLLTSKKFMQFKGLIDRCEAGVTGIGLVEYDGSENTKPITSVDLEGFWSMLGLQIDNLDNRFENLKRWKLNDWNDPDEIKTKIKKNLTKVKKAKTAAVAKAKPSSALQQMLRKMQAEMRKTKNADTGDVALKQSMHKQRRSTNSNTTTPRKSIDTSNTRRLSIVVKDRKYFSPAATVISVSSSNLRTSKMQRKSSEDSPKIVKHLQKFNAALDSMQSALGLRKTVLINENSRRLSLNPQSPLIDFKSNDRKSLLDPVTGNDKENYLAAPNHTCLSLQSPNDSPLPTGRKSILKTPGTAKSRLRNVIFNEKLRVKKFNFLINEDGDPLHAENRDDANQTHEEDLAKSSEEEPQISNDTMRTLTLRNRKVHLRPSFEIVIPKN